MASSWMIRHRSSKGRSIEEYYKLDPEKSDPANVFDIVVLLADSNTNEPKRLCLLNALAKVFKSKPAAAATTTNGDTSNHNHHPDSFGYSVQELFQVISIHLYHHFTQIRAAALRSLRHLVRSPADLLLFNALQLPDLVCRSLDIILKNDEERAQALKLIRRMLIVEPSLITPSVVRCLVSLSEGGAESNDRMLRSCLAVLCEFGVLHPKLLICCGGVSAITRNVLEFLSPRIAESLCGVLLHLLEWPETRSIAGVRLDCLAAPYCDFTYRAGIMNKNKDARDLRFTCSRLALLSILRSWSGIIEFCDPSRASGLKAIVDILYLNQLEVRKAVLDLLYELLNIPQPVWTDEFSVAFATIDPSDFQDAWRLSEGFVAAEGRSILPTLAKTGPNVCEIHTAMLLYCFLESGLMDALVEVIVSSDTFISVRATVLLGKLTHLMHRLLPPDISAASSALPTLIGFATKNHHQATAAIAALQAYHQVLKNRPASCSLFLDCIVRSGELVKSRFFRREINAEEGHIPLQGGGGGRWDQVYHRINRQELIASQSDSGLSSSEMSSRTFINELKKRRRHNSSGSNSIDITISEVVNTSVGSSSGGGGGSSLRATIPSLKRTGSIKLNKFFQILDPFSQAQGTPMVNFIVDNREVVHLNTDKEHVDKLIRDSQVLTVNEAWDWEIVVLIFKNNLLFFLQRMDDTQLKFLRRIIEFFKPSSNRFSHSELMLGRMVAQNVHAGVEMIDWYMRMSIVLEYLFQRHPTATTIDITARHLGMIQTQFHGDCMKYLREFVDDLNVQLDAILTKNSAHDCLFSPQHMMSTMCQQYFLFIGRFCQVDFGVQLLTKSGIFDTLEKIVATTNHVCYIKLIVTALDYSQPTAVQARKILALALRESKVLAGRLYATQFLLVLMRAKITNFHKWGVRLLVDQALTSTDKSICLAALEILEEACHEPAYLSEVIALWPEFSADKCGDAATLLVSHFYSQVAGLEHSKADVAKAIGLWETGGYCKRYVLLVEAETHATQTLHSKNEDGTYCRRSFSTRPAIVPPNVLPHLFGQLARTRQGCSALKQHGDLRRHLDVVLANNCTSEESVLELKASLYALGNTMTSEYGVELLQTLDRFEGVVQRVVEFVKYNEVYSVRATSLNVLGLIGSTSLGAGVLYEMDWLCVRHDRNTMWPVSDHEEFYAQMMLLNNGAVKHGGDCGLSWPAYNFNPLTEMGSSPGPLNATSSGVADDEEVGEGMVESDAVDGVIKRSTTTTQRTEQLGRKEASEKVKSPKHHIRSLSESKTTDRLHMWSQHPAAAAAVPQHPSSLDRNASEGLGMMFLGSRQRINSGTDSNTSGVSSCDSTCGRNHFTCDLQQTLSPIPSTSDLLDYRKMVRPNFDKYNRWCEEQFRKISLTGLPVRDVKINPQDVQGYAKIRHIKRNQRPVLSESAAEDLMKVINVGVYEHETDRDYDNDDDVDDDYRLMICHSLTKTTHHQLLSQQRPVPRSLKVRSLDRQQQGCMVMSQNSILKIHESSELSGQQSKESLNSMSSRVINAAATTTPPLDDLMELSSDLAGFRFSEGEATDAVEASQPCYMGICLPRNILNLFPRHCAAKPYVGIDLEATMTTTPNGTATTVGGGGGGGGEGGGDEKSVDETDHVAATASEAGSVHPNASQEAVVVHTKLCLHCSRTTTTITNKSNSSSSPLISNSLSSSSGSRRGSSPTHLVVPDGHLSKQHKKLIMLGNVADSKRMKSGSAGLNGESGGGVDEEDLTLLAILINVQRCANPVLMKQAKMNLLELKQKHGEYFQDLCLYSEVLKAIGRNTYRQTSRRFLQELFLDIDFESLFRELVGQLNVYERSFGEVGEGGVSRDTTSYGSMTHEEVELRLPRTAAAVAAVPFEKIEEEMVVGFSERKSLPEPMLSPTRSTTTEESESNGGGTVNKGFARVQLLSCSFNKFPVRRDRANSLNTPSTTERDY